MHCWLAAKLDGFGHVREAQSTGVPKAWLALVSRDLASFGNDAS